MSIVLEGVTKRYAGHMVVNRVSLEIPDGEFFVLLGPSGSGKSTVLRMIAGLNSVDEGRIRLHGQDVTTVSPQRRGVGFVFQNYALFRHMTVGENVEFALRVRRVPAPERRRRRDELLELVGLAGLGGRLPSQLSGGQQQRVALARALAHNPPVLLLDEPFGALDALIRVELRRALRHVQRELGITTLFVTHDQEEAFELADRLGVMNFGRLLEVGLPPELYQRPQTEFVASFLGTANLLVGQCADGAVQVGSLRFPLHTDGLQLGQAQRVQVLFRPEDVALGSEAAGLDAPGFGEGQVEGSVFSGSYERLRVRLPSVPGLLPTMASMEFGEDALTLEATRPLDQARRLPLQTGDRVWVGVRRIHALVHPGLRFLLPMDGSAAIDAALAFGGTLARLAHARVTLLGCGLEAEALLSRLQKAKEELGSGLAALEVRSEPGVPLGAALAREIERQDFDLVVLGFATPELAGDLLESGGHHLLLVPGPHAPPRRALICAAAGEPGKDDVLFAGQLARHLGAEATLLTVLAEGQDGAEEERVRRFLRDGERTLDRLGVRSRSLLERGPVPQIIARHVADHDMLVLGAPLQPGGMRGLWPLVAAADRPTLVVRSHYTHPAHRITIVEEVLQ